MRKLSELTRGLAQGEDLAETINEIQNGSDRSAALLASAMLESQLEVYIEDEFIDDLSNNEKTDIFEGTAPLATFGAKIRISYALGLVGKITRNDLIKISKIRNVFAHSTLPVSFKTPEIQAICDTFEVFNAYKACGLLHYLPMPTYSKEAKSRFIESSFAIATGILYMHGKRVTRDLIKIRSSNKEIMKFARNNYKVFSKFKSLP